MCTYSVASCLCLQVVLRIPIAVIDDDSISSCQVKTEASCLGAEQEYKALCLNIRGNIRFKTRIVIYRVTFFFSKPIDSSLSILSLYASIETLKGIILRHKIVFKNVQHLDHLTEYQHLKFEELILLIIIN